MRSARRSCWRRCASGTSSISSSCARRPPTPSAASSIRPSFSICARSSSGSPSRPACGGAPRVVARGRAGGGGARQGGGEREQQLAKAEGTLLHRRPGGGRCASASRGRRGAARGAAAGPRAAAAPLPQHQERLEGSRTWSGSGRAGRACCPARAAARAAPAAAAPRAAKRAAARRRLREPRAPASARARSVRPPVSAQPAREATVNLSYPDSVRTLHIGAGRPVRYGHRTVGKVPHTSIYGGGRGARVRGHRGRGGGALMRVCRGRVRPRRYIPRRAFPRRALGVARPTDPRAGAPGPAARGRPAAGPRVAT